MKEIDQLKQALQSLYAVARAASVPAEAHENTKVNAQAILEYLEKQPDSGVGALDGNSEVAEPELAEAGGQ